jgi:tyrosyl-tRNA synthetase
MEAKIALGKLIVTDFHSAQDAERAADVFNAVVRRKEVPDDIPTVPLPDGVRVPVSQRSDGSKHIELSLSDTIPVTDSISLRVDKLLAKVGLADSVSEGQRKIKAGAVEINGEKVRDLVLPDPPAEMVIQVGKNWRRVRL